MPASRPATKGPPIVPEGDTLWNHANTLRPVLVGQPVTDLRVHRNRKKGPRRGVGVAAVEARGKHLLITFDDGVVLHTHLQMTGVWHLYKAGERWRRSPGAMRALVQVPDAVAVCFSAPTVGLYHPEEPGLRPWQRIGPDLCLPECDFDQIAVNLERSDGSRQMADVLLDQAIAAGIGNVYKSEALWFERVSPFARLDSLDEQARSGLYQRASRLLRQNLGRAKRRTLGNGLAVYGRGGRDCPRCRATVSSVEHGDDLLRVSYWCPRCQPATTDPALGHGNAAGE